MAQHDYVLENASGALFRQDMNNVLRAIAENNMGATAPTTTYAGMWWLDTSTSPATLRIRNNTNIAWVSCGNLNEMSYLAGVTSDIQTQLNAKAALASPALTGTPTAPTAVAGTNTTQLATTAFVKQKSEADSIGVNQTWQARTGMIFNTIYTNTSGKPIVVNISTTGTTNADQNGHIVEVNGVSASGFLNVFQGVVGANGYFTSTIVPNNQTYKLVKAANTNNIVLWSELR